MLKNTISFLFVFAILWGCKPQTGVLFGEPEVEGAKPPSSFEFKVNSLDVTQQRMTITGEELDKATKIKITGPNNFSKTFALQFNSYGKLMAVAKDTISLPLETALNLIIGNAHGQSSFPITFTLQPGSVGPDDIEDGAATRLTLNKEPTDSPNYGQILKWDTTNQEFFFSNDIGAGEGGTGTVTQINLGQGILNPTGEPITSMGTVALDLGTYFSATPITNTAAKIPFINEDFQMVLDSTADNTKLFFKGLNEISIYNDGVLRFIDEGAPLDIMILSPGGDVSINKNLQVGGSSLTVAGTEVCLANGTNCQENPGAVSEITVTAPITGGGTSGTVNIGLDLSGVVSSITAGPAISVDQPAGSVTVGVVFGSPGNAQEWNENLDNISLLAPTPNGVMIGATGTTDWEVQSGVLLTQSLGLEINVDVQKWDEDLDDIAALSPATGSFIIANATGTGWTTDTIPSCGNYVVVGDGTTFTCSDDSFSFKTGETHFVDSSGNYVSLRAPTGASVTDYSLGLPPTLGSNGDILKLDGSGNLYFMTPNYQENTSDFLAEINIDYLIDTSTASVTMTLPASPTVGDRIGIFISNATNTATIDGNGKLINGSPNLNVTIDNQSGEFVFNGSEWKDLELGTVVGPASSTISNIVAFGNITGSSVIDTGIPFSSITALEASSTDYDLRISANQASITVNEGNISTNVIDIATNASATVDNAANISANVIDIAANASATVDNAANISTNVIDIAANASATFDNSVRISVNETDIAALTASSTDYELRISASEASITVNEADIATLKASATDYTLGPVVSTANAVPYYLDTTGKLLADSPSLYIDAINDRVGVNTATPTTSFEVNGNTKISGGLEISSTTEGFLPPRMTLLQRDAIASPTAGLFVYNIEGNKHNYYDGTSWEDVGVGDVVGPASSTMNNIVAFGDTEGGFIIDSGISFTEITDLQASSTNYELRIAANEASITVNEGSISTNIINIAANASATSINTENISVLQASSTDYALRISASEATITALEVSSIDYGLRISASEASITVNETDIAALQASSTDYVLGPASATDSNIVRYDGVTGKITQDSLITIDDAGNMTVNNAFTFPNVDGDSGNILQTDGAGNISWTSGTSLDSYQSIRGVVRFHPPVYQNVDDQAIANPQVMVKANANGMFSANANYDSNMYLPDTTYTPNGQPFYFYSNASSTYILHNDRTDMVANLTVAQGDFVIFIYNANLVLYEFQGVVDISSIPTPNQFNSHDNSFILPKARGTDGQVIGSDGAGNSAWIDSASPLLSINAQAGNYTLTSDDCGNIVTVSGSGTLSVPVLATGCKVDIIQLGTGQVTIDGTGGMNEQNAFNLFKTRAQYSVVTVTIITSTIAIVTGDVN